EAAAAALRSRFSVIMVDEFQDTDRMQWQIFHRGFADTSLPNPRTLIIVGDPKQAIYRFRGADVATYISAAHTQANSLHALAVNQRSDALLLEGLNALFAGSTFDGADRIKYETVAPREGASEMGISFPSTRESAGSVLQSVKPIEIRWVSPEETTESTDIILADLVDVVREHLGATLPVFDADRCEVGRRDVEPGDIGILVKSNTDGDKIALLLRKHGIPAVRSGVGSVEQSPAAVQLRALLYAMERPSDTRRGRLVGNGWFFGLTPTEALEGTAILEIQQQLAAWAEALPKFGVFHLWTAIRHRAGSLISIATHGDGDRGYTDLEHLIEVLNRCLEGRPGSVDLCISILDDLASHASESEERRRRIDSDSAAVQITTIHSAKGLEYPIVLLPLVTKQPNNTNPEPFVFGYAGERLVDAGPGISWSEPGREGTPADRSIRKSLSEAEVNEEDRRLAYVALTRAKHRLVVWVRHSGGSEKGGLGRLLWGDRVEGALTKPSEETEPLAKEAATGLAKPKTTIEATACYDALVELAPTSISHRQIWMSAPGSGAEILDTPGGARATKMLDPERVLLRAGWRAWSYSSLTDDKSAISNYGPEALRDDEPDEHLSESESPSEPNPWDALSAGTGFGDAVHRILEEADFALLRPTDDDTEDDEAADQAA
ncbi:MAG: UvrD-helicase domain-containing protein, partial [Actinomycetes bacterium]